MKIKQLIMICIRHLQMTFLVWTSYITMSYIFQYIYHTLLCLIYSSTSIIHYYVLYIPVHLSYITMSYIFQYISYVDSNNINNCIFLRCNTELSRNELSKFLKLYQHRNCKCLYTLKKDYLSKNTIIKKCDIHTHQCTYGRDPCYM